jgi:YHS domain-containing protein
MIDPVCGMTIDPAAAAASEIFEGRRVYFCSQACRRGFLANPADYMARVATPETRDGDECCSAAVGRQLHGVNLRVLGLAGGTGLLASAIILSFYFGMLILVSGWQFTLAQFAEWWPYILTLAVGFGIQAGLFVYLRRAVKGAASAKVIAATGTTSGAAMVSCCSHYLVNLLPVLGATGLVSFVGAYQAELFWFGIASNLAGIAYVGRRAVFFAHGA